MTCGRTAAVFDASGLSKAIGAPDEIVAAVRKLAADDGLLVRVAMAGTRSAAWLLAHASSAPAVVLPGGEAAALAPLSIAILKTLPDPARDLPAPGRPVRATSGAPRTRGHHYRLAPGPIGRRPAPGQDVQDAHEALAILGRWGIATLGELAALPRADVRSRLGEAGVRLHEAACGEDVTPLVPAVEPATFEERLELEWPIEGLEPLTFVLGRLFESLAARLERADRGVTRLVTRLGLVSKDTHERVLTLPAPMRDPRVLRTLVALDLESHPPAAAIDVVAIQVEVAPGRIDQGSLLERSGLVPEDLSTLLARLSALVGETRVGTPVVVDSHDTRQVALVPFRPGPVPQDGRRTEPTRSVEITCSLRRFRLPVAVRVAVERGRPARVDMGASRLTGGRVVSSAGPWRTSGRWWSLTGTAWDRDEWDVAVESGSCYRLSRDRATGRWEIEGVMD